MAVSLPSAHSPLGRVFYSIHPCEGHEGTLVRTSGPLPVAHTKMEQQCSNEGRCISPADGREEQYHLGKGTSLDSQNQLYSTYLRTHLEKNAAGIILLLLLSAADPIGPDLQWLLQLGRSAPASRGVEFD